MTAKLTNKQLKQAMAKALRPLPKAQTLTLSERFAMVNAKPNPQKKKSKKSKTIKARSMNGNSFANAVLYPHMVNSTTPIPDGGSGRVLTYVYRSTVDVSSVTSSACVVVLPALGMNILYSNAASTFTNLKPPSSGLWLSAQVPGHANILNDSFKFRTIGLGLQVIPTTPPLNRGGTQVITRIPLNGKCGPAGSPPTGTTGAATGKVVQIEPFTLSYNVLASRPGALVCNTDRGVAGAAIRQDLECEWNNIVSDAVMYASYPGDYSVPAEQLCQNVPFGFDEQFGGLAWRVQSVPTGQSYTIVTTHVVEVLTQLDSNLYLLASPRPPRNIGLIERLQSMADMTDGVGIVSSEGNVVWRSDRQKGNPIGSNPIRVRRSNQLM